jgi:hypothetical protein
LHGALKSRVSLLKQIPVWACGWAARHKQSGAMETLKTVDQHRSVCFIEDIWPHLDNIIRCYSNHVSIERRVVESAQCDAVWDRRDAKWIGIGNDVRRFQKFVSSKTAHRAVMLIGVNDAFPKLALM